MALPDSDQRTRRPRGPVRVPVHPPEVTPAAAGRRGASEQGARQIAALCAWDMLVVAAVVTLTNGFSGPARKPIAAVVLAPLAALALSVATAYRPSSWLREHPIEMLGTLTAASTAVAWAAFLLSSALMPAPDAPSLLATWLVPPLAWYAGRRIAAIAWRRRWPERILIVGSGEVAERVQALARRTGAVVVGSLDDGLQDGNGAPVLGSIDHLPQVLAEWAIDRVVIAFSARRDYETLEVLRACSGFDGTVDIVPRFFDFLGPTAAIYSTDGLPLLSIPGRRTTRGRAVVKRALDIVGAGLLIIVLSPLLAAIALAIVVDSGRPVLFLQQRIGRHGRTFSILKFRTLAPGAGVLPEPGGLELTPDSIARHVETAKQEAASRATRLGAVLRRTSLDELPQLLNVLVGHMSLVGPRPLSPLEDATLEGWEMLRREVRPGITGLWQVSGRSEVSWDERISLDYRQVRHWSLSSDLRVLAETVGAVLRQRGAE